MGTAVACVAGRGGVGVGASGATVGDAALGVGVDGAAMGRGVGAARVGSGATAAAVGESNAGVARGASLEQAVAIRASNANATMGQARRTRGVALGAGLIACARALSIAGACVLSVLDERAAQRADGADTLARQEHGGDDGGRQEEHRVGDDRKPECGGLVAFIHQAKNAQDADDGELEGADCAGARPARWWRRRWSRV